MYESTKYLRKVFGNRKYIHSRQLPRFALEVEEYLCSELVISPSSLYGNGNYSKNCEL